VEHEGGAANGGDGDVLVNVRPEDLAAFVHHGRLGKVELLRLEITARGDAKRARDEWGRRMKEMACFREGKPVDANDGLVVHFGAKGLNAGEAGTGALVRALIIGVREELWNRKEHRGDQI
jgi:hypothetical protein